MQLNNCYSLTSPLLTAGDNTIIVGGQLGVGKGSIRVWQMELFSTGANTITPKSNTTVIPGPVLHTVNGSSTTRQASGVEWAKTLPGQAFVLNVANGATTYATVWYTLA